LTGSQLVSQAEVESLLQRVDFRKLAGKSLLITGAGGMVGSYLCDAILRCCEEGDLVSPKLTLLVRQLEGSNLAKIQNRRNVKVIECNLSAWNSDTEFDYCIHAASPASPTQYADSEGIREANVGFLKSLAKGRLPSVLLFLSSGEVYGPQAPLGVTEEFAGKSAQKSLRSIYPEAKKEAEVFLMQLGEEKRTNPIVVRLFHSYGPGVRFNDGRSFADFLWSGAMNQDITLRSSGEDVRSFMYLEDSIAGILCCLTRGEAQESYNVGSEYSNQVADFAEAVGRLCGVSVIKQPNKESGSDSYVHSPNKSLVPSNAKLRNLGWSQQVTLEEGIRRSIKWIRTDLPKNRGELS
jgi:UDP-glucuronate decarboxylase